MTTDTTAEESTRRLWIERARRSLRVLLTLVILAMVVPFVIFAAPMLIGAEGSYVVLSGSMEPAIGVGDVVFVYAVDPGTIQAGDVVTYSTESSQIPTTHRVTEVIQSNDDPSGVLLRTMGDANEDPDRALVRGSAVYGVVPSVSVPGMGEAIFRFPFMGYVIQFANTNYGFILLVGLPLGAFILNEIWTLANGSPSHRDDATETGSDSEPQTDSDAFTALPGTTEESHAGGQTSGIQVDVLDLKVAITVLGGTAVYAIWVAYNLLTPWSISVAVAAIGTFLYLTALRYRALGGWRVTDTEQTPAQAQSLTDGGSNHDEVSAETVAPLPQALDTTPRVWVDSPVELMERVQDEAELPPGKRGTVAVYLQSEETVYAFEPMGNESPTDQADLEEEDAS